MNFLDHEPLTEYIVVHKDYTTWGLLAEFFRRVWRWVVG